ncbi:MAG TPA: hypothetical protein VLA98_13210 [Solirubrobacteraceae bacterium]|nr:hypothetical protein [Solirubrobacteraceae bacterium]HSD80656.1 hypothetical protein [Solirubrobacteraceae bacterium]
MTVPVALGAGGVVLLAVAVLVVATLAYMLVLRGNPRQAEIDADREEVAEEAPLKQPVDFQADLKPPRDQL